MIVYLKYWICFLFFVNWVKWGIILSIVKNVIYLLFIVIFLVKLIKIINLDLIIGKLFYIIFVFINDYILIKWLLVLKYFNF